MAQNNTYTLSAALDIAHAAATKTALQELLQADGDIELDGAQVDRIDAAGLQLLASFFAHCNSNQRGCSWASSSQTLQQAAFGLGLAQSLQLENDTQPSTDSGVH